MKLCGVRVSLFLKEVRVFRFCGCKNAYPQIPSTFQFLKFHFLHPDCFFVFYRFPMSEIQELPEPNNLSGSLQEVFSYLPSPPLRVGNIPSEPELTPEATPEVNRSNTVPAHVSLFVRDRRQVHSWSEPRREKSAESGASHKGEEESEQDGVSRVEDGDSPEDIAGDETVHGNEHIGDLQVPEVPNSSSQPVALPPSDVPLAETGVLASTDSTGSVNPLAEARRGPHVPPFPTEPPISRSRFEPSLFPDPLTGYMEDRLIQFRPSLLQNNVESSLNNSHPYQQQPDLPVTRNSLWYNWFNTAGPGSIPGNSVGSIKNTSVGSRLRMAAKTAPIPETDNEGPSDQHDVGTSQSGAGENQINGVVQETESNAIAVSGSAGVPVVSGVSGVNFSSVHLPNSSFAPRSVPVSMPVFESTSSFLRTTDLGPQPRMDYTPQGVPILEAKQPDVERGGVCLCMY